MTTTEADDLVTAEIDDAFARAYYEADGPNNGEAVHAALRAVAPMIAARAELKLAAEPMSAAEARLVAAEREAIARIVALQAETWRAVGGDTDASYRASLVFRDIAAAIRARGET
jgi:acetylornithine deacetylase/succinyl-diaminopimelate desuccinylase-like protein